MLCNRCENFPDPLASGSRHKACDCPGPANNMTHLVRHNLLFFVQCVCVCVRSFVIFIAFRSTQSPQVLARWLWGPGAWKSHPGSLQSKYREVPDLTTEEHPRQTGDKLESTQPDRPGLLQLQTIYIYIYYYPALPSSQPQSPLLP